MPRGYHALEDAQQKTSPRRWKKQEELTEAELELLQLLKCRGVPSICESITKEINYVWAVLSGFKTLANVGNFYFACGSQAFGYNPAYDFFGSHGMQLAVFALQKFVHNENVLVPVLECIYIYTKLHVDGAVEFLAVAEGKKILMKCIRYHDNKHDVISGACQALGSLVMNDLVKESLSSPDLVLELLGLVKRYHSSCQICRAVFIPLSFFVTDASITATFVDGNGIALTMTAMKAFIKDTELVWHAIGILNGLNSSTLDARLIYAIFNVTGIPRIVEAVASHLDTEEIAVEGFQLLSRLAAIPDAYKAINQSKVLDLAYVALFAYSGPQHRHTRVEIKRTMHMFQKCTLMDPKELAQREQASRTDVLLYALFVLCLLLSSAFALYGHISSDMAHAIRVSLLEKPFSADGRTLRDVNSVQDVWMYLFNPMQSTLFQEKWYNGDPFALDVDSQLGMVDRANVLLGGVELRLLRVREADCTDTTTNQATCFPPFSTNFESKESDIQTSSHIKDSWSTTDGSSSAYQFHGKLATYPSSGFRQFLPRLSQSGTTASSLSSSCNATCRLTALKDAKWLGPSSRALFVQFNLYNPADDLHCAVTLLFEFASTGGLLVSTEITPLHFDQYPATLFLFSPRFYTELGLLAGVVWFGWKQLDKLLRFRWFYFTVLSHLVDFAIVVLWVVIFSVRLQALISASHALYLQLAANDSFVNLATHVHLARQEHNLIAWCGLLMWWRLFRFAKCLKPLEKIMDKFERAEALLQAYLLQLLLYVLSFAQAGVLLFSVSVASFRNFSMAIATMTKALVKHWNEMDLLDHRSLLFRLLFHFATAFVVLNMAVAILRERFDSSRENTTKASDGVLLLELAKRQLAASGMQVQEVSLPKKFRLAASHGLEKLHHAAREVFAIADDPVELTSLKKVWGLEEGEEEGNGTQATYQSSHETAQSLLRAAEDYERQLDQQLNIFAMRLDSMTMKLRAFQEFIRQELHDDSADRNDDEKLGEQHSSTSHSLSSDTIDQPSLDDQTTTLPGAITTTELQEFGIESDLHEE